jgi:hypothetical protein
VTATPRPTGTCSNKLLGQLYHCLQHGNAFDEPKAFRSAIAAAA